MDYEKNFRYLPSYYEIIWNKCEEILKPISKKSKVINNKEQLIEIINRLINIRNDKKGDKMSKKDYPKLEKFIENYQRRNEDLGDLIGKISQIALKMKELFPDSKLKVFDNTLKKERQIILLNNDQISKGY
eukprot:TRINITY_DN16225_c0_g1_i1.p1 TRINITY_DN16225_c0_g1~~TRINITY_DN16225_c0_g1_i1.p1  ORF type:complete len:131 (-),score=26.38 TRINITY_DN16225_c0_g1_i1:94-486(-)